MVSNAPDAIDVVDFQFREHVRLKAFQEAAFPEICSLVTVASRFGLIFIAGDSNELQVIQVKDIENLSKETTEFKQRVFQLPSKTLHIAVNCDSTKLAVVIKKDNCPHVMFYDVLSFLKQNIQIINHTRLSQNPECKIVQIDWNPALPDVFTAVKDDGTLLLYDFKGAPIELPPGAKASCFCWSPKGKQLAVGSRDGKITQYKIDLKAVKVTEAPPGYGSITSLCWVSSFQFFGVYQAGDQISLVCVDAPKSGATLYTNYDDVCYSNGFARPEQFYLIHQLHWNVLFVASSNSMEIAILGMDANSKWTQWNLNDNVRAALPLGPKHEDTLPIGCVFNVGTTKFKIGDDLKQGPALFVLSDHGSLVMFNAINTRPGAMDICSALENVSDRSGEAQFVLKQQSVKPAVQVLTSGPTKTPNAQVAPPTQSVSQAQVQKPVASFPFGQSTLPTNNPTSVSQISMQNPGQGLFGSSGIFKSHSISPKTNPVAPSSTFGLPTTGQPTPTAFSSAFGTKPSPVAPVTSQVPTQPQPVSGLNIPKNIPVPVQTTHTSPPRQVTPPTVPPSSVVTTSNVPDKLPVTDETEAMIAKLVRDECLIIEGELFDLLQRGSSVAASMKIGTDTEMADMARKEHELDDFYTAIKENINTHDSEVYTLKQALLQTWACYEEARTRLASSKDPVTKVLLHSMPLDPASQHQLNEIDRMIYYIDSQLGQANNYLDEQWDTFQDAMMKKSKLVLPTMESVYQSMVKHARTLQKQKYMLKHIAARIKATNRTRDTTLLNVTRVDAATNFEGLENLEEKLSKLQIQQSAVPQLYNRLIERQSKLNVTKVKKLQEVLRNRAETTRVSVCKPQLNNSTVQLTTLLAAPLSPIGKGKKLPGQVQPNLGGVGFDKLINSTPKPKNLAELKMPKVPVQTFSPTPFGASSPGLTNMGGISGTNLFGKPTTPSADVNVSAVSSKPSFSFKASENIISAPTTVSSSSGLFGKSTVNQGFSTTSMFGSLAGVVPVPGPGNTISAPSQASAVSKVATTTSTLGSGTKTFGFASIAPSGNSVVGGAPVPSLFKTTTTSSSGSVTSGLFASIPAAADANTGISGGFMFSGQKVDKPAKPALLATPTTPPVSLSGSAGIGFFGGASKPPVAPPVASSLNTPSSNFAPAVLTGASSTSSITSIFTNTSLASSSSSIESGPKAFGSTTGVASSSNITSLGAGGNTVVGLGTGTGAGIFGGTVSYPTVTEADKGVKAVFGAVTSTTTTSQAVTTTSPPPYSGTASVKTDFVSTPSISVTTNVPLPATTAAKPVTAFAPSVTAATTVVPVTGTSIFAAAALAFGGASTTTTTAAPAFGITIGAPSTTVGTPPTVTTATPTFGTPLTAISAVPAFGTPSTATTAAPAFGTPSTATTATPAFGTPSTATTAAPAFGTPSTATTAAPAFGTPSTATTPAPAFGTSTTFGSAFSSATPTFASGTTTPSAFGMSTTTPASAAFGSLPTATTTAAPSAFGNIFAAASSTFGSSPSPSVFGGGGPNTATTTAPSIFAAAANQFGNPTISSSTPPFGQSSFATAPTTTTTPFGGGTSSAGFSSSSNLFAQPAKFASGGSIFGGGTTAASTTAAVTTATTGFGASPSVFGGASTTKSMFGGTSAFGTASNSPFASSTVTPTVTTQSGGAGIFGGFGQPSTFGSSTQSPATNTPFAPQSSQSGVTNAFSGFGFGQSASSATPAANPFGAKPSELKSPFGTTAANIFATPASTTSGSVFGSPATPTSAFGSSSGFGGNASFGQSGFGNTSFGSPAPGAFSGGSQSVQQAGFGSSGFQKPGFGSAPVFGSSPAFGGNPSFGASPTFGGGATFGSPGKVFGGGAAPEQTAAPFGSPGASSNFGSIAQQNTVGFGNLAQQASAPAPAQPFSGGSSFTNWRN